jgi:hypothetical protein
MPHKKAADAHIEKLRELCAEAENLQKKAVLLCAELEKRLKVVSDTQKASRKEPRGRRAAQ